MATSSSYGQGAIFLSNYVSSTNIPSPIKNAANIPIGSGFTIGLYWVSGNVVGSVGADPSGTADPSTLGGGLAVGTSLGSTAAIGFFGYPGAYQAGNTFVTGLPGSSVITLEIVAYNGANYGVSNVRGHSAAFAMTTTAAPSPTAPMTGPAETAALSDGGFRALPVPEPTTMALGGLGGLALLLIRRKQA